LESIVTRLNHTGEDVRLARALKQRDPEAMAQLYDNYGALVYSRVYSLVQNGAVAEDLVQEVFLRVWTRAKSFDETRGPLCGWVLAVARNRAIDYLRSRESQLERNATPIERHAAFDSLMSCENEAVRFDLFGRLRAALGRLNFNQRMVLRLAFEEGLSHTEVAQRLQRPLGTVKTQIRLAIKDLRAQMPECRGQA
jgi:RNA polymerase sigma-70 factor (ECF subfamily)